MLVALTHGDIPPAIIILKILGLQPFNHHDGATGPVWLQIDPPIKECTSEIGFDNHGMQLSGTTAESKQHNGSVDLLLLLVHRGGRARTSSGSEGLDSSSP
mmetsp:Transcript_95161/g.204287  ORF Transcript_95161/g.204287 Transcript_95161/m.204287 type:complete len:101 (-) Transcript_95161:29-331(-)